MSEKIVELSAPFEWHGEMIKSIRLREPTGADLFDLGEPSQLCRSSDGTYYETEFVNVIKQYADRLIVHESGSFFLKQIGLADAKKVKETILGFFIDAVQANTRKSSTP